MDSGQVVVLVSRVCSSLWFVWGGSNWLDSGCGCVSVLMFILVSVRLLLVVCCFIYYSCWLLCQVSLQLCWVRWLCCLGVLIGFMLVCWVLLSMCVQVGVVFLVSFQVWWKVVLVLSRQLLVLNRVSSSGLLVSVCYQRLLGFMF